VKTIQVLAQIAQVILYISDEHQASKARAGPGQAVLRRPAAYKESMPAFHTIINVTVTVTNALFLLS